MFCRNCGKELAESAEICISCGVKTPQGDRFCNLCGAETSPEAEICVKCGVRFKKIGMAEISDKSRLATALLAWFLGYLGIHRFYIGKTGTAVVMLILGVLGWLTVWFIIGWIFLIPVEIWALIDFIFAITGNMKDKDGKVIKNW
ncbi:MAG: TM2 domain-containing protein [candidate division WOR-3 bacterium]|nr:TM2 domain-containing protein [candidate division WOR-3 bacterium]